jgi:beta-lactamase class A
MKRMPLAAIAAASALATLLFAAEPSKGYSQDQTTETIIQPEITSATKTFSPGFKGELEKVVAAHHGVMGLSYHNLKTNEQVEVNGDVQFPTASTIKLAVMCTVFDEFVKPNSIFKSYYDTRKYDEATSTGGSGFVHNYKDGTKIELKELLHFMITVSDNVATNMICEWLGLGPVNDWLSHHGFVQTRMFSTIGGSRVWNQQGREEWGLGRTTPHEMAHLMEMIATGKAGTTSTTGEMLRLLQHQYFDDLIGGEVPPMVWIGSKSGAVNHSRSDNAIVASCDGTYILSVYTKDNTDTSWTNKNEAELRIREIAKIVWKHANPESTWTRPEGADKF